MMQKRVLLFFKKLIYLLYISADLKLVLFILIPFSSACRHFMVQSELRTFFLWKLRRQSSPTSVQFMISAWSCWLNLKIESADGECFNSNERIKCFVCSLGRNFNR